MAGFSSKLPLSLDFDDGMSLNKNLKEVIAQNLKMIILTIPGERIMIPEFGVGLKTYLFENDSLDLRAKISSKIYEQVSIYMPFVEINNIFFESSRENDRIDRNALNLRIEYFISPLDTNDSLDVSAQLET